MSFPRPKHEQGTARTQEFPMVTKQFLTAGHAIFTASNPAGEHFTFRVTKPEDFNPDRPTYFVSVLTGPDNLHDYTYLGVVNTQDGGVRLTARSKFTAEAKSYAVGNWAVKRIWTEVKTPLPAGYAIQHAGRCGRCGRTLTTDESISQGFGPECVKFV